MEGEAEGKSEAEAEAEIKNGNEVSDNCKFDSGREGAMRWELLRNYLTTSN